MSKIVLWDYPKSSASYRVRIALNLAGLRYEIRTVNLLEQEHRSSDHLDRNPQGLVPVLDIDGIRLTQSLAILDYLDQTRGLGFLPTDPGAKAKAHAAAYAIAVDIHPVCNLSVVRYATGEEEPARTNWMTHFIRPGLIAVEAMLRDAGKHEYAIGEKPGLVDICLMPQLYNAKRWKVDISDLERINAVGEKCTTHPAFQSAHPDQF